MAKLLATKIHPAIGIARLGNHPTDYFIGPENPNGFIREEDINGFKKTDGEILKIKRQAARFRIFGYYDNGDVIELNSDVADIEWKIKVANTKGAFEGFLGTKETSTKHRNCFVPTRIKVPENIVIPKGIPITPNRVLDAKNLLKLSPKEVAISGVSQERQFEKVKFTVYDEDDSFLQSEDIVMGECKTDEKGRLLVLGGYGQSGSVRKNVRIRSYDDNNYWFDDVSDGYVKATVKIKETNETYTASDAWVIIAPPKYVPNMHPLVSLYDTLYNRFIIEGTISQSGKPKFYADIYPILQRALNIKWLFEIPLRAHDFTAMLDPNSDIDDRELVFLNLRKPSESNQPKKMPKLFGDDYRIGTADNDKTSRVSLTELQYKIIEDWKNNNFEIDSLDTLNPTIEITAEGLDKAALENCIGAAFFPGIETSWFIRDKYSFIEPFRLNSLQLEPGDLTKQNALPWQADFLACSKENINSEGEPEEYIGWWPYARPDDVFAENENTYHAWTPSNQFDKYEDMVEKWKYLGIIVERNGKFVEVQREFPPAIS